MQARERTHLDPAAQYGTDAEKLPAILESAARRGEIRDDRDVTGPQVRVPEETVERPVEVGREYAYGLLGLLHTPLPRRVHVARLGESI